jgi:hypothetical protein
MLGNHFVVEYSPDSAGMNWADRFSISNLPFSPYLFLDTAGASQRARFYRAFMQ